MPRELLHRSAKFRSDTVSVTKVTVTSKIKDRRVNMASRVRTRLTLDEMLSGVFDDDSGLSDSESSDQEREKVYILTLESIS